MPLVQVTRADVIRMLDRCAPGYVPRSTNHRFQVEWRGHVFRLPRGAHGDLQQRIPLRSVRAMVEQLEIEECAQVVIRSLAGIMRTKAPPVLAAKPTRRRGRRKADP